MIIDLAGLLHVGLLVGFLGAAGVFAGGIAYEWIALVLLTPHDNSMQRTGVNTDR